MTVSCTQYCDLHTHSTCSDGTWTPEELVRGAEEANLKAIALTDHNTVRGLKSFMSVPSGTVRVPGCEFTSNWRGMEIHMVGLFLPEDQWPAIEDFNTGYLERKTMANRMCVERLQKAGYKVDYDEILSQNPGVSINRVHIARALMKQGYLSSVKEGFSSLLEAGRYYIPPEQTPCAEVVESIAAWGGVAVWAHPLLSVKQSLVTAFIDEMLPRGLAGVESVYTTFTPAESEFVRQTAAHYGLLQSGGSDFHGDNKPGVGLGTGKGNLKVPAKFYDALLAYSRHLTGKE